MKFAVYLEVTTKKKSGRYWCYQHTISPSRLSRVSLQPISHIIPQYSLTICLLSNSCTRKNGVRHCLPQMYPNRLPCCLKPAPPHPLVFSVKKRYHLLRVRGDSNVTRGILRRCVQTFLYLVTPVRRKGQTKCYSQTITASSTISATPAMEGTNGRTRRNFRRASSCQRSSPPIR